MDLQAFAVFEVVDLRDFAVLGVMDLRDFSVLGVVNLSGRFKRLFFMFWGVSVSFFDYRA